MCTCTRYIEAVLCMYVICIFCNARRYCPVFNSNVFFNRVLRKITSLFLLSNALLYVVTTSASIWYSLFENRIIYILFAAPGWALRGLQKKKKKKHARNSRNNSGGHICDTWLTIIVIQSEINYRDIIIVKQQEKCNRENCALPYILYHNGFFLICLRIVIKKISTILN